MHYSKPSAIHYRLAQLICGIVARLIFRRKVLRNEIRDAKGPFVVIANHQAALDFVNLIGLCRRPMSFVISNSFYSTLPVTGYLNRMGVIPKQQFQTTVADMKKMKAVIDAGQPLVIYPAGLMCEDGLSTPIPGATYKFLKWLGADVYVAKTAGTYFAMPKWSKGLRPGQTTMDVYKLMSAQELAQMDMEEIRRKTDAALLYDAYREQEQLQVPYARCSDIRGLEQVLYMCPHCDSEYTMQTHGRTQLFCAHCACRYEADRLGFLHRISKHGPQIRYVSDWSKMIYERLLQQVQTGAVMPLETRIQLLTVNEKRHKFCPVGEGTLILDSQYFHIRVSGRETINADVPIAGLPILPFSPGNYFEVQDGKTIYRCVPQDAHLVMKFINLVKIYYTLNHD